MKPFDDRGNEVDAEFSVDLTTDGFGLILESRSGAAKGSTRTRNAAYAEGLELLLSRMVPYGATLLAVALDSTVARAMREEDRVFEIAGFETPLHLTPSIDLKGLRLELGRLSSAFGRTSDPGGGNRTKRLRFHFAPIQELPSLESIQDALVHRPTENRFTDGAPEYLFDLAVQSAVRRMKTAAVPAYAGSPDAVEAKKYETNRFDRDPNVVAAILFLCKGRCEVCDEPAPFVRLNGEPFLEVHHVRRLAHGGPDATDNAVACCPNCHRRLHHGHDRKDLRKALLAKIQRLVDYPHRPVVTNGYRSAPTEASQ